MAGTRNQEERIEVLDKLFSNNRKWTSKELISKIADETGSSPIDQRTLFRYFNYLEEKGAPLHRPERADGHYYYKHRFSIKEIILDAEEVASLKKAIDILKEVDNFELLEEVDTIIKKLENRIHANISEVITIVQFEKHTISSGHEYINDLLEATKGRVALRVSYQPYSQLNATERIVHPYLLKEFRNRWFLFGREHEAKRITIYALDRIKKIKPSQQEYVRNDLFDPNEYFKFLIGVSVPEGAKPETIEIKVHKQSVPYILSKPIHFNQEITKKNKDGSMIIRLNLIINYELKSILLSYADGIEIKKPAHFKNEMKRVIGEMKKFY